jgi:uncharacterized RDD family membrane protein YckC
VPGELAERGARLLAATFDELIMLGIALPMLGGAVPVVMNAVGHADPQLLDHPAALNGLLDPQDVLRAMMSGPGFTLSIVAAVAWCVVTTLLVASNGQSIGKRLVGIKVVRKDGSKASLARIFLLRNVVNFVPMLLPFGVGWLYQLLDPVLIYQDSRQCMHDRIADTIVVRA